MQYFNEDLEHDPVPSDRPHDAARGSHPGDPIEFLAPPCRCRFDFTSACIGAIVAILFALVMEVF